jgi:ribosomal-protein-alanine N-acetyltransferase
LLFPILETNRLRLDSLSIEDSNSVFELFSNDSVVEYYDLEAFTEESQATKLIEFF